MLGWLFGIQNSEKRIKVHLTPDSSGRSLPGFAHGGLDLDARVGETLSAVMERFNTYRGPDSQITKLYSMGGAEIPFSTRLTDSIICVIRKI